MAKVSVIVPVYNVEKYLKQCLDSIVDQTLEDLEIVLVDDGSVDSSGTICDEYAKKDTRIRVIHKENGGLSDARNAGLKYVTSPYVGFIDSDDYIDLDFYCGLLKKPTTLLLVAAIAHVYPNGSMRVRKLEKKSTAGSKSGNGGIDIFTEHLQFSM